MRPTLSRSTTTKSRSEYLVKTLTQKFTLGSIDAGRGNGSLVSERALGAAATNASANVTAATAFAIRFLPGKPLPPLRNRLYELAAAAPVVNKFNALVQVNLRIRLVVTRCCGRQRLDEPNKRERTLDIERALM